MTTPQIKSPIILDIPSDAAALCLVRGLVEKLGCRLELSREETHQLVLAVDEACANVIRHAYKDCPDGRIHLTFHVESHQLEILVRDFGCRADVETLKPRQLEDVRPGGLGLHFMQSAMDRLSYESRPDGGTLLRMVKFRTKQKASSEGISC